MKKQRKRQTSRNIILNILAFGVQFVTNFYISPVIVGEVGAVANGFISLANDFTSYASVLASVFNSVAARFIATAYYKKDYQRANAYFNSLLIANIGLSAVLGTVGIIVVAHLDSILSIPETLVFDVKLTFLIVFVSYIITLLTLVFTTSTFVSNRTDIQGIRNIISYIIKFACVVIFLNLVSIRIYWISIASLIATAVVAVMNVRLTKVLTPELSLDPGCARREYILELGKSGCWMAFNSISTILLRGLDLTIANVMIGGQEMGLLSIARTFPNTFTGIIGTLAPIFTPVFIALYARGETEALVKKIKESIRICAGILFVPICGFIVFSPDFYRLWQGSLSETEISIVTMLSNITVVQAFFNGTTATMAQISVVVNKLKLPVLVTFVCGLVSIILDFLLLRFTNLGIYAIVLSPTLVLVLRYVLFNSLYGAYCLNRPKSEFVKTVIRTWCTIPVLLLMMLVVRKILPVSSWSGLILDAAVCATVGYIIVILIIDHRKLMGAVTMVIKKMRKGGA